MPSSEIERSRRIVERQGQLRSLRKQIESRAEFGDELVLRGIHLADSDPALHRLPLYGGKAADKGLALAEFRFRFLESAGAGEMKL